MSQSESVEKRACATAVRKDDDFVSHRGSWREALVIARDQARVVAPDVDEKAYWDREIRAYDEAFSAYAPGAIPDDFRTHHAAWREALVIARDRAIVRPPDVDDRSYWEHECRAYDRAFASIGIEPIDGKARVVNGVALKFDKYGVPEGCTHFIEGLFGSVRFLQYRETSLIRYFAEFEGDQWAPMGTQPSAQGLTPRVIAEYHTGLPHEEFVAVMHAVWLADGDASRAAQLLGVSEERIWEMNAGQADAAFCSRPETWNPDESRDYLRGKGYEIEASTPTSSSPSLSRV
ncbi:MULTISPECIES: hypothetical protein [unclassified Burkholderia]|uniref:hypothetical protein n=1 Tax=unclassified Burkholderia TaxID=2613784 RepID=UPI002AB1B892|nr:MULTISPECIES: hypothetical protein [unclassified Burkholderia]